MANKRPLVLYTGPNKVQELLAADRIDVATMGLTGAVVGTTDTQTLTAKTLTLPKVDAICDANGNESITVAATASAVNNFLVRNTASGAGVVSIEAEGADVDIDVNLVPKGAGTVQVGGSDVVTAANVVTLTNKTLTTPRLSAGTTHPIQGGDVDGGAILDSSGRVILGTYGVDAGTYLVVRNNGANGDAVIKIVNVNASSTDANAGIRLRPKGTGTLTINRSDLGFTTNQFVKILDNADNIIPHDFRALAVPPGSGATLGYTPGGLRTPSGLTPLEGTDAIDLNRIFWYPFFAPRNGTSAVSVTGFTVCTNANHNTAVNMRAGIWTNTGGSACYPSALVSNSEVIQAIPNTADTVVTNTSMTASLTPGSLYWMGFCFEAATAEMFCHNVSTPMLPILGANPVVPSSSGYYGTSQINTGIVANFTYGAFSADTSALLTGMGYITNLNTAGGGVIPAPNLMHQIIFGS